MPTLLGVVGASVRAAAASAVRAGFEPVAADRFGDDDLVRIAPTTRVTDYPNGLLDWLKRCQEPFSDTSVEPAERRDPKKVPDTLTPTSAWMYAGALENHPELVDAMSAVCPLWGNGGAVLREVRSPWRLAEALGEAGLLFPETRAALDGLPRDGSWLVKTGRGAGGSGVKPLKGAQPSSDVGGVVFQRRVAGDPVSAVFVAAGGAAMLLGAVHQLVGREWLGAGEFQYCGAIGPFKCAESTFTEIERIGGVIADRFGLVGLFGVDLVIDVARVWTIEVNPRYTASVEIVERSTGVPAIAAHADACTRRVLPLRPQPAADEICGKAVLFAKRCVSISEDFADWADRESRQSDWRSVADLSPAGTRIAAAGPIMTVFAAGGTVEDVENQLRDRVAEIERRV